MTLELAEHEQGVGRLRATGELVQERDTLHRQGCELGQRRSGDGSDARLLEQCVRQQQPVPQGTRLLHRLADRHRNAGEVVGEASRSRAEQCEPDA